MHTTHTSSFHSSLNKLIISSYIIEKSPSYPAVKIKGSLYSTSSCFFEILVKTDRKQQKAQNDNKVGQTLIPDSACLTFPASQDCVSVISVLCNPPSPRKNRMFLATLVLSFLSNADCKVLRACDLQNSGFSSSTVGQHTDQTVWVKR